MFNKILKGRETTAVFCGLLFLGAINLPLTIIADNKPKEVKHQHEALSKDKKIKACEIEVGDKASICVRDKKTAKELLGNVKKCLVDRFELNKNGAQDVVFKDNIELKKLKVDKNKILTLREAKKYLTSSETVLYDYTIKNGDTFWDISSEKKLSVTKLVKLNSEHLKSLKNGDVVKLYKMVPRLSLRWTETFNGHEEIPYNVVNENTSKLFKGKTVITQKGKPGLKDVTAVLSKVDGDVVNRKVLQSKLVQNPVSQHQLIGTSIKPPTVASGIFRMPVLGSLSSRFGARWGRKHTGVDLCAHYGQPIKATDGGKVIFAGSYFGYGNLVKIDHENGYVTYYGHCSQLKVSTGERVYAGQLIALVGSTGHSTGPHLHFEVRKNGVPVNPLPYIIK